MIYTGHIGGAEALGSMAVQLLWLFALVLTGRLLMRRALKKVVVQGG